MPGNRRKVDVDKAYEMIREGRTLGEISDHFHVSHPSVCQALKRAGLPTSARKYRQTLEAGTLPT